MAPKALGWAFAVVVLGGAVANAQVDLGKMLGSLTFGDQDPPSATGELPAPEADAVAVPEQAPLPPENIGSPEVNTVEANVPELQIPDGQNYEPQDHSLLGPALPPSVGEVRDVPDLSSAPSLDNNELVGAGTIELTPPPAAVGSQINMDELIASSEVDAAGELGASEDCQGQAECTNSGPALCGTQRAMHPFGDRVLVPTPCIEHPNLPPPTTPVGSYRTPACYRNLWAGFADERAAHCQHSHRHIHGHCGCLQAGSCGCTPSASAQPACGCADPSSAGSEVAKQPQGAARR